MCVCGVKSVDYMHVLFSKGQGVGSNLQRLWYSQVFFFSFLQLFKLSPSGLD